MNLLDLNNDILNIIGVYVKKENLERKIRKDRQMMSDKQIINGKEIRFCPYHNFYWFDLKNYDIKNRGTISKDDIKKYLFNNIDSEIKHIKVYAQVDKNKLTKADLRLCIWICLQRFKFILNDKNINLNIDDENNYLTEYLKLKKLNLKTVKNLSVFLEKIYL